MTLINRFSVSTSSHSTIYMGVTHPVHIVKVFGRCEVALMGDDVLVYTPTGDELLDVDFGPGDGVVNLRAVEAPALTAKPLKVNVDLIVNTVGGHDNNPGTREAPIATFGEVARRLEDVGRYVAKEEERKQGVCRWGCDGCSGTAEWYVETKLLSDEVRTIPMCTNCAKVHDPALGSRNGYSHSFMSRVAISPSAAEKALELRHWQERAKVAEEKLIARDREAEEKLRARDLKGDLSKLSRIVEQRVFDRVTIEAIKSDAEDRTEVSCCELHAHKISRGCFSGDPRDIAIILLTERLMIAFHAAKNLVQGLSEGDW